LELTRLRGFQDLFGADARAMSVIEQSARMVAERHNTRELRIPVLERASLYLRTTGETTDIVEKQMYTFADRDEDATHVALRPEGTPGVVRAYIEAGLDRSDPEQRFYYSGPMFRRERPQKGRYRQFYQFGVEVFGRADPACDAELLVMIDELRRELRLDLRFEINTIGCPKCRPAFRDAILAFGRAHLKDLCEDCHQRLERNPMRILDCKIDTAIAAQAPESRGFLCAECRSHYAAVLELLARAGVTYVENSRLVRGLDYYTRTTFEIISPVLGAQSTVIAGGRYDGLVEAMGGAAVPGSGFAIGVDRLALAVVAAGVAADSKPDAAIIALGDSAAGEALGLARRLRAAKLRVELLSPERRLKALLSRADKIGARFALILGENELARGVVQLRDLRASAQREVTLDEAVNAVVVAARGN
jgi:histidyl-tRNA synthetase